MGIQGSYHAVIDTIAGIGHALPGLDAYELRMSGKGPGTLPLFEFDVTLNPQVPYRFEVSCHLAPEVVSTSDDHREGTAQTHEVASFGEVCSASSRAGFFTNPKTGELIQVPTAGCARFWVEFAFGEWLFPEMRNNSLDLLPARAVGAATQAFGLSFVQGCHWG